MYNFTPPTFLKDCCGSPQKTTQQQNGNSITEAQHPGSSTEVRQIGGGAEGQNEEQGFKETFPIWIHGTGWTGIFIPTYMVYFHGKCREIS